MRKRIVIGVIVVVVVSLFFLSRRGNESTKTTTIMRGDVVEELVLSGAIQAKESASLQFLASGPLQVVNVEVGDLVQKGQLLARLDTTNFYTSLQQAQANLRSAEATLARVYDEVKGHDTDESFTQREVRTAAEAAKDVAYNSVVQAQQNLSNASLYSPITGFVSYVASNVPGVNVTAGVPMFEIINPGGLYFTVFADQTEVTGLRVGQEVNIILDSFPDKEIKGMVTSIPFSASPNEVGVVYEVEISIPVNAFAEDTVRVGMTGDAAFVTESATNILYVPPSYVQREGNTDYLLTDNGRRINVEVGVEGIDKVEVRGDIEEGMTIYQE